MHDILDLDQFPLDQPDSPEWQALVNRCRADLAQDGMFNLDGLMRQDIAAQSVNDMKDDFRDHAFFA